MRLLRFIRNFGYNTKHLVHWLPTIWHDYDHDWVSVYAMLERKFADMAEHNRKYSMLLKAPRIIKELRLASALCKRIVEDEYLFKEPPIGPWRHLVAEKSFSETQFPYWDYMLKQDLHYLHKLIDKRVQWWWS